MHTEELIKWLDDYLDVARIEDYPKAWNGLQVEGKSEVFRIALAVDACLYSINEAVSRGADMLIVHHGLFWEQTAPVTRAYYRKLSAILSNNLALYSCHLPLDMHPEVGNNAQLARLLNLTITGDFGMIHGAPIGVYCDTDTTIEELSDNIEQTLQITPYVMATGPRKLRRIGIISGGAGQMAPDAKAAGCDALLTGEGSHSNYFLAEEYEINLIFAGHYATETVGIKALGDILRQKFHLDTFFIDHPTGL
jgi:dinuclear metal center YbgI/SA1388 family protein